METSRTSAWAVTLPFCEPHGCCCCYSLRAVTSTRFESGLKGLGITQGRVGGITERGQTGNYIYCNFESISFLPLVTIFKSHKTKHQEFLQGDSSSVLERQRRKATDRHSYTDWHQGWVKSWQICVSFYIHKQKWKLLLK